MDLTLCMPFIAAGSTIAPIVLYISTCVTHMGFVTLTLPKMIWSCKKIGLTVFGLSISSSFGSWTSGGFTVSTQICLKNIGIGHRHCLLWLFIVTWFILIFIFIHFHLFFLYIIIGKSTATNLHHLTSLLSLEKVDLCIILEHPLKEALAIKGPNSDQLLLLCVPIDYPIWLPGAIIASDWRKFQRSSSILHEGWNWKLSWMIIASC